MVSSDDIVFGAAYFDTGILASKLSLTVILSPGLISSFTSSSLMYLLVIGAEVEGLGVDGCEAILGLVLEMVAVCISCSFEIATPSPAVSISHMVCSSVVLNSPIIRD